MKTFGDALRALKEGKRVARSGWNGKGMWLVLVAMDKIPAVYAKQFGIAPLDVTHRLLPWIGMKTADDGFVPWLASQTDVLAEDWTLVA